MDRKTLVSVVTIFFNEEKFIEEAVESVFAQKYGNWELLLVDDGSTDKSTEIARRFAEKHPEKVRYFEHDGHKNRGMSASRNLGIRNAVGEYIAFLDADDVWLPHKLERQVAILDSQPRAAIVFGTTQYWYSWTGSPEDRERDFVPDLGVEPDKLFRPPTLLTLLYPLGKATAPCPSDLLLRREVIEHIGGFEEEFRGMYEDQVFLVKAYLKEAVFVSSECWDRYRIHPTSCVSLTERAGEYNSARKLFLNWFQTYLFKTGITEARVWAALQNALWPYQQSNRSGTQTYNAQDNLRETEIREIKWWLRIATGSIANLEFVPDNRDIVKIAIKKAATDANSDIQLNQPRLKVKARHRYVINFLARADSSRSIFLGFAKGHAPWSNLGLYSKIELTSEWQNFGEDFIASEDEDNARIHFDMGNSAISVELATVTLRSLSEGRFIDPDLPSLKIAQAKGDNNAVEGLSESRERLARGQKLAVRKQTAGNDSLEEIEFGTLRRVIPVSQDWGWDRGLPIDRYYIENFLTRHKEDIRGAVLEIGDDLYTRKFGSGRVVSKDVLHVVEGTPGATIIADLTSAEHVPSDAFDCILLTQTLQYVYDIRAALKTLYRILKPGGVLLATIPGMSGLRHDEWAGWFWGFTAVSARRLFEEAFPGNKVMIQAYGNVLVAISFLHGLAVEELRQEELDYRDSRYEVLITVRATKPVASIRRLSTTSKVTLPRFSIIIPTYQRRDLVLAAVRALAHQQFDHIFEVIVVVDGSEDGSAKALEELEVPFSLTVLEQPNRGRATACNEGAAVASGEILLFLDDDMEAHPRLLAEHDSSHQKAADAVFGHLPLHPKSPTNFLSAGIKWWTDGRLQRLSSPGASLTLHDMISGQMSLSRELFHSVGGFDTNFTAGGTFGDEDIDFCYRLKRAGYRSVFNPDAISWQNYVVRPRQNLRQRRQAGRADVAFARKHPEQARTIFTLNELEKRSNRLLWRPLVALSPFTIPIMAILRWLVLASANRWPQNPIVAKAFWEVWTMEYWRGVWEAGGMPRPRPVRVLAYHAIRDLAKAPVPRALRNATRCVSSSTGHTTPCRVSVH